MSLTINDLLFKIKLPKRYFDNNFDISQRFRIESKYFLELLTKYDFVEFQEKEKKLLRHNWKQVIKKAEKVSNIIELVFNFYAKADYRTTQKLFNKLMNLLENDFFIGSVSRPFSVTINRKKYYIEMPTMTNNTFYRVRASNYKDEDIEKNLYEIFHIPFTKRAYCSNERYSLAGCPCLYLSSMLPLAWQECGYPKSYYYSRYDYKSRGSDRVNDLKLIFILSPTEILNWGYTVKRNNFEIWLEIITRYLKSYPLILACSFVNQRGSVPYKQEYIIPQMMMQWVQRNNDRIQGISYFTCHDTSMHNPNWTAYNVAIPAIQKKNDEMYSEGLQDFFSWSKPKYYSIPIFDQSLNRNDRKIIYDFILRVRNTIRMYRLPSKNTENLLKMIDVSVCLLNILEAGNTLDVKMALGMLNVLKDSVSCIKEKNLLQVLEAERKDEEKHNWWTCEEEFREAYAATQTICEQFAERKRTDSSIEEIIYKYIQKCWNYPNSDNYITTQ